MSADDSKREPYHKPKYSPTRFIPSYEKQIKADDHSVINWKQYCAVIDVARKKFGSKLEMPFQPILEDQKASQKCILE